MKKGSITIYMSLVLSVLLSLFLTVIEGARYRAISLKAECAFDLAVYSVFGEYNRQLYEEYGLFFIDTAYGENNASMDRVRNHLRFYMEQNLDESTPGRKVADITKCFVERADVTGYSYATDENGKVFQRQAIEYMKHKYGISYVEKLKKELETASKNGLFTKDFTSQRNSSQEQIDKAEREGIETDILDEDGNPVRKEIDLDNPADGVNQARSKGILLLVTQAEDSVSERSADLSGSVSAEKPPTNGQGLAERDPVSLTETMLFDAYIALKCGNYRNPKENGQLAYQLEYVLGGKDSDIENLKAVVHRLLFLREVSNVVYLLSDAAKTGEAATLATSICTAAGAPVLIEPLTYTLLFAWAYAEAVYDVKQLLAGGSIPLLKTAASWHYSLQGMLALESEQITPQNSVRVGDGLDYEEYLRLFLAMESGTDKVYRMMDIAQMDVRKNSGFGQFRLSHCVDRLVMEATVGSKYGYYKEMKRMYYYV